MSRWLVTTIFLVLAFMLGRAHAEPVVRFFTTDYPPYTSTAYRGGGAMAAVVREALALHGYRIEIETRPWARAISDKDEFDGLLVLWPEEIRTMALHYYLPIFRSRIGFFTRLDTPVDTSRRTALAGRTVGIARGYGYPEIVFKSGFVLSEQNNDLTNLRMLIGRRFDLALLERPVGEHLIKANLPAAQGKLIWNEPALAEVPLGLALVRNDARAQRLQRDIANGLAALKQSGRFQQIVREYGVDAW